MPSPDYNWWLNGHANDVKYNLLEITHPSFTKPYRIVNNNAYGLTVTHEDGVKRDYTYVPVEIQRSGNRDDLDQAITVAVADLGEDFPKELQRLRNSAKYAHVKPVVNLREYLSSDLDKPFSILTGLELNSNKPSEEGQLFFCEAKRMNDTKTGMTFNNKDFPTMRGM